MLMLPIDKQLGNDFRFRIFVWRYLSGVLILDWWHIEITPCLSDPYIEIIIIFLGIFSLIRILNYFVLALKLPSKPGRAFRFFIEAFPFFPLLPFSSFRFLKLSSLFL